MQHEKRVQREKFGWSVGLATAALVAGGIGWRAMASETWKADDARAQNAAPSREPVRKPSAARATHAMQAPARTVAPTPRASLTEPAENAAKSDVTGSAPNAGGPTILASEVRTFASAEEELGFWRERLPGERLTLEAWSRSLGRVQQAIELGAATGSEQATLEERAAALQAKLAEQTARIAQIEQRIGELEGPSGSK